MAHILLTLWVSIDHLSRYRGFDFMFTVLGGSNNMNLDRLGEPERHSNCWRGAPIRSSSVPLGDVTIVYAPPPLLQQ